jgi:hypothetical protein
LKLYRTEAFYEMFGMPDERTAFAKLYPDEFARMFGLERKSHGHPPASIDCVTAVFQRWNIIEFLRVHTVTHLFDAPDLRPVPFADRDLAMALTRARWWMECKLPILQTEVEWLKHHAPGLLAATPKCPSDDGSWDRDHDPVTNAGRL